MQRSVINRDQRAFQDACRPALQQAAQASCDRDYSSVAKCLDKLALVPRRVLSRSSSHAHSSVHDAYDSDSLPPPQHQPLPSSLQQQQQQHQHQQQQQQQRTQQPRQPLHQQQSERREAEEKIDDSDPPRSANTKRVVSLLKRGHLSRAAKALFQRSSPRTDPQAIDILANLHPSHPSVLPPDLPELNDVIVDGERLHGIIKRMATGAAPGPTGWTAELLLTLWEDSSCAEGLHAIISDICNARLPDSARKLLLSSRLLAIPKSGGGLRPISIGEILYRVSSSYLMDFISSSFPSLFPCIQKGVGARGGADRARHAVQLALELLKPKCKNLILLSIDIKNAFNTLDRRAIAQAIIDHEETHSLWRFFKWSYELPSSANVFDRDGHLVADISSMQGLKQGDPVASFLFALTLQDIFSSTIHGLQNTTAIAFLDDLQIVGEMDSVFEAYSRLSRLLPDVGLEINPLKSACLWPDTSREPPVALTSHLQQHGNIPLHRGFMVVLEAPVGWDDDAIRDWCSNQVLSHDYYFNALRDNNISGHHALLLLKSSLRPSLNYALRCVPPPLFADALTIFDSKVLELLDTKVLKSIRSPLRNASEFSQLQAQLSDNRGGIGLMPSVITSLAAFIASIALAIQDVRTLIEPMHLDPDNPNVPPSFNFIVQSVQQLQQNHGVTLNRLPHSLEEIPNLWRANPPLKLQHKIMDSLQKGLKRRLLNTSSGVDKARLVAASSRNSATWLRVDPNSPFSLSNNALAFAICHRLGLPSVHLPSHSHCACRQPLTIPHLHGCKFNLKAGVYKRHNKVKFCLARLCRLAGLTVEVEESSWVADLDHPDRHEGKVVPDVSISGLGQLVLVDVSIICPVADTYATRFSNPRSNTAKHLLEIMGGIIGNRCTTKNRRYASLCEREGSSFTPFVALSTGSFCKEAISLLWDIANHAALSLSVNPRSFFNYSLAQLSAVLQEGNYLVESIGLSLACPTNSSIARHVA